jgi:hypothetical protein
MAKRGPNRSTEYKDCPKCGENTLRKTTKKSSSGKFRWECRKDVPGENRKQSCYSTVNPGAPYRDQSGNRKEADKNPQFRRKLGGIKRFIVTAAQNATPVHWGFWNALKTYCKENDAELVVIPIRYKNATSRWTASQANEEWWLRDVAEAELAEEGVTQDNWHSKPQYNHRMLWSEVLDEHAAKYLYNQRKKLNENLVLLGDIKTQPTATKPLSGFESITHGESGILGHTKLQLETIPTPQGRLPKILTTTGAVTLPNYTDSKAGKKGEFHHAQAATVVDIVGKKFFMYQANADKDGGFQHLNSYYFPDGSINTNCGVKALVLGDTHRACMDATVEKVTFSKGGIVDELDPEYLVFHDLHDGYARNHHHRFDPFTEIAKRTEKMHLVKNEVHGDIDWLEKVCKDREGIVVPSNHDCFFARWIMETDWRRDPDNASFYLETAKVMVDSAKMTEGGAHRVDPFIYWVERLYEGDNLRCLKTDESFTLAGIELGLHGDKGPNGARGSRNNLRRIGVKTIIGHSHSPGIEEGCYQTGTSTPLRLEYNSGPSSWMNAHCILYPNGKRSLVFIIDGDWRF